MLCRIALAKHMAWRGLHGHRAAVVHDLMHAAVRNRIALPTVDLGVHDARDVGPARCGNAAPQLNGNVSLKAHILNQTSQFTHQFAVGLLVLRGEILHGQARTVLQLARLKAACRAQVVQEVVKAAKLAGVPLQRGLLRTREELDACDVHPFVTSELLSHLGNLLPIKAELAAARKAQQHGDPYAAFFGQPSDQLELGERFDGETPRARRLIH